jgi:hypothetical protein
MYIVGWAVLACLLASSGAALAQTLPAGPAPATSAARAQAAWFARQMQAAHESDDIMRDADKRKGMLAKYEVMRDAYRTAADPAFTLIFSQYLSWYQTFVGDYLAAARTFSIKELLQPGDHPSPLADPAYSPRPALDAIARLASKYQIVYLNEAHNVPLTRTLTAQLLEKLRTEGFTHLGMETIYQSDAGLQARGYPVPDSGFYTREPIDAEMVRTALKLGFQVFGYEALSDATGNAREAEQARNIYEMVFKHHPHARLVVVAGYAHIQKSGVYLDGSSMATHLHQLTGIDGLAVEQTMMIPHAKRADDHPYYRAIWAAVNPRILIESEDNEETGYSVRYHILHTAVPIVYVNRAGQPWTLRDGYDVSVIFPPQETRDGRPTWLTLGGLRQTYSISGARCRQQFPCMVEARYADEGADAIPADRIVLDPLSPNSSVLGLVRMGTDVPDAELYLRPGTYDLRYTGDNDRLLYRQTVHVTANGRDDAAVPGKTPAAAGSAPASSSKP